MDIKSIRKSIDIVDYEIVKLLSRRMEDALRLVRLKKAITEPEREREVMAHVRGYCRNVMDADFVEQLYRLIIEESKRIQKKGLRLVGFQGEHGAYSEVAAGTYDPVLVPIPCTTFHEVFQQVESGQLDLGIVPVENSLEGAVTEVNDLLIETRLSIVGEVNIPIHHCLLALPGTDYRQLKFVCSHPQALAQCRAFVGRSNLEQRPFYDTAGAAAMLREQQPAATAAIASKLCADLYGLDVVKEAIEDHPSNTTRFVLLSKEPAQEEGNKCSTVFSVTHRPGGLFAVLELLATAGINMTRIESRPLRNDPGSYAFFLDFQGSDRDPKVRRMLDEAKTRTMTFRFLGCYREYEKP